MASKKYPRHAGGYQLKQPIGKGSQAVVWLARCLATDEEVAIKIIDLINCTTSIDAIRKEIQVMSMCSHPNVVEYYCSFVEGHFLWVVMELLGGGSCLDVMKFTSASGFGEVLISTILYQALRGLDYFHKTGRIHCDVKAGNLVVAANGTVKMSDFGVSTWLTERGERKALGKHFVGTPCWMAPEVIEQRTGYDYRADIWSFGITALELARGEAPLAKFPPMKVLMMTLQNPPPRLDAEEKEKYSKHFKDLIHCCLQKDPEKRPSASKLLEHKFFRQAKGPEYVANTLLDKLPPLWERLKATYPKIDIPREITVLWSENKSVARNADDKFSWDFGGKSIFKTPKAIRKKDKEEKKRAKKLKKLKKREHTFKPKMLTRTQSAIGAENFFKPRPADSPDVPGDRRSRGFTVQKVGSARGTPAVSVAVLPPNSPRRHSDSYENAIASNPPPNPKARVPRASRVHSDLTLPHSRAHSVSSASASSSSSASHLPVMPSTLSLSAPSPHFLPGHIALSSSPHSSLNQIPSPALLSSLLSEQQHSHPPPLRPEPSHNTGSPSTSQQSLMQQQIFAIFQQNIHHTKMLQDILNSLPPRISTESTEIGCDPLVLVDALSTMQHQVSALIKENQRLQKENQELKKKLKETKE